MKTDKIRKALDVLEFAVGAADSDDPKIARAARRQLAGIEASDREARVADFHRACGLPVASEPTFGTPEQRVLRVRLMLEEVLEFAKAACVVVHSESGDEILSVRDLHIGCMDLFTPDLAAMTHELADVQYVTSGTAVELGLPLPEAFSEIHGANMRKVGPDGKVVMVNGKVCKPEGWVPADVAKVLKSR